MKGVTFLSSSASGHFETELDLFHAPARKGGFSFVFFISPQACGSVVVDLFGCGIKDWDTYLPRRGRDELRMLDLWEDGRFEIKGGRAS